MAVILTLCDPFAILERCMAKRISTVLHMIHTSVCAKVGGHSTKIDSKNGQKCEISNKYAICVCQSYELIVFILFFVFLFFICFLHFI